MINIRQATPKDAAIIFGFIRDLAIYEKAEHEVKTSVAEIKASLFNENSTAKALICEIDNQPVGFAVYFLSYSTWLGKSGLYLEDLYVSPKARGKGAGLALMKQLAEITLDAGYGRFEWRVLDWNTPSISFYDSIGAEPQSDWIGYRLEGAALEAFGRKGG